MEQEQDAAPNALLPTEEAPTEAQPTKSVKNFWERLDEVFAQNNELKLRMEDLVGQFPEFERTQGEFKSFLFQPERIAITSNDDLPPNTFENNANPTSFATETTGHAPSEQFSSFRVRLKRPLRNVKAMQLLSATIPNVIQNIPNANVFFFYYRLRNVANSNLGAYNNATNYLPGDIVTFLGNTFVAVVPTVGANPTNPVWQQITLPGDTTRPNYYDLNPYRIQYVYFTPTYQVPFEVALPGQEYFFNRTFQDYQDVVTSLNQILTTAPVAPASGYNCSIPNDVTFGYNAILNKVTFKGNDGDAFYLPCGYEDRNITTFMIPPDGTPVWAPIGLVNSPIGDLISTVQEFDWQPGYTLNYRLGYTWNGLFPNPFSSPNPWLDTALQATVFWYMRGKDPDYTPGPPWIQDLLTFNSYPDLVNTSCVRIYADFTFGSTQDSMDSTLPNGQATRDGLLSIVPVNTTNLGVGFYQNNFNNPLTKIPQNIAEIGITMYTDQGLPFYLPNSATVLLELGIDYQTSSRER